MKDIIAEGLLLSLHLQRLSNDLVIAGNSFCDSLKLNIFFVIVKGKDDI